MSAQTNPLVSILSQASSELKSQELLHSTTYVSLESIYASEASEVSLITSVLATNPSASLIYASLVSKYSTFFLPSISSTATAISNDTSTPATTSTPSASSNPFSSTLPAATSATSLTLIPFTSLLAASSASSPTTVATSTAAPVSALSPGAKIGLGVGIGVGLPILILLSVLVFLMLRKQRKSDFGDSFPQAHQEDHHAEEEPPRSSFQHDAGLTDHKGKTGFVSRNASSVLSEKIPAFHRSPKPPPTYAHPGIPELDATLASPTALIPQKPIYELDSHE